MWNLSHQDKILLKNTISMIMLKKIISVIGEVCQERFKKLNRERVKQLQKSAINEIELKHAEISELNIIRNEQLINWDKLRGEVFKRGILSSVKSPFTH